ncbi:hypothetical protein NQ176_g11281 [Zarea fungicola]|uniref:Uncharacterized protein n=1 Tax=Zarea fungicola TaxID=93591 RepID=A0ACC1MD11_9HYPO|nr:hypothetical protein NQ176_g11281 [Lecanicillium fungicola]
MQQDPPPDAAPLPSSILYRSQDNATIILDIPRSLEESQVLPGLEQSAACRIYSSAAPTVPYETPEPANGLGVDATTSQAAQIATLMTTEHLRSTVQTLSQDYIGPYCLPREVQPEADVSCSSSSETALHIPPRAEYLHGSIHQMKLSFSQRAPKFQLIILDPPLAEPLRPAQNRALQDSKLARYYKGAALRHSRFGPSLP